MTESIDVNLLSREELQERELFNAANKDIKSGLQEMSKYMKQLEKAGLAIPQDLKDRYLNDKAQYASNKAKQEAKDAIAQSIAKVTTKFNDFKDDINSIRSALSGGNLRGGSVMHQAARMGLEYVLKQAGTAMSGHAGSMAGAAAGATGAARGAGTLATATGEAASVVAGTEGMLGKAAGKAAGWLEAAGYAVSAGVVSKGLSAASAIAPIAAKAAWVLAVPALLYKYGSNKMYEQGLEIERRKTDIQISEQLFVEQQALQFSSQLSVGELASTEAIASSARGNTAHDYFSFTENMAEMPLLHHVTDFLFGETSADARNARLKRGQDLEIQTRKHHAMARRYGSDWEMKTSVDKMIKDARTDPQSVLALQWAKEHSLDGPGSYMATLRGFGNGYGLGPTDAELLDMATRKQAKYIEDKQKFEAADRARVFTNPAWRNSDHERTIWIDEVGKHRYKTTLNWNKV